MFSLNRLLVLGFCVLLTACLGSGSGSSNTNTNNNNGVSSSLKGVFVDSAIANIGYRTESREGVTSDSGEFEYLEGEKVTFFIGGIEFPEVDTKGIITPLDIVGTENREDPKVVNMIRLLQSLDEDGDPENGISISDESNSNAVAIDFELPEDEFEAAVIDSGLVTSLVAKDDALSHFEQTLEDNNIPSSILPFTLEEIKNQKYYIVFDDESSCGSGWFADPITFDDSDGYTLDLCNGRTEVGNYSVTESGLIKIVYDGGASQEFTRRVSLDSDIGDFSVCIGDTEAEALECSETEGLAYFFSSEEEANAFLEENNESQDSLAFTAEEFSNKTYYVAFYEEDWDCDETLWYFEPVTFDGNNQYTVKSCYPDTEIVGTYSITDSGLLTITYQEDDGSTTQFYRRMSSDPDTGGFVICIGDSEDEALNCNAEAEAEELGYYFSTLEDAEAFVSEQTSS